MSQLNDLIAALCPQGTEFHSLDEIGTLYGGLTGKSKADFADGNARFVTYMNVFNNIATNVSPDDAVQIGDGERQNRVHYGDVLFTASSESVDEVGMASGVTVEAPEPLYLNSFCFGFRPNDAVQLDPEFAKHLFRSAEVRRQIIRTANGVTRINIAKERFRAIKIPVPPLAVQREIAGILDKMRRLEAELDAELEARRTQYAFYQESLLSFSQGAVHWMTLGDVGDVSMCKRVFKKETSPRGEIPFYKIGTFGGSPDAYISRDLYESYRARYSFPKKGDVLLSAAGTIGRAIPYDGKPAYFQDSNIVWVTNDESVVKNSYLRYWYRVIKWTTDGGTIRRLYNQNIRRAHIAVPSLAEQERIVAILDCFDTLVSDRSIGLPAELKARREQYEHYRDRLLTFSEAA